MKTKHILLFTLLIMGILAFNSMKAQKKIEYSFGNGSDVVDSIKTVIEWYKANYHQSNVEMLNLYAGIDFCDGFLNIFISRHSGDTKDGLTKLSKSTNRYISVDSKFRLPIIFSTDVLSEQLQKDNPIFIKMNGYYIRAERNEKFILRVTRMNQTF